MCIRRPESLAGRYGWSLSRSRYYERAGIYKSDRNSHRDSRATSINLVELDFSAHQVSSLTHSDYTDRLCSRFFILGYASPVIADCQDELALCLPRCYFNLGSPCVSQNVG